RQPGSVRGNRARAGGQAAAQSRVSLGNLGGGRPKPRGLGGPRAGALGLAFWVGAAVRLLRRLRPGSVVGGGGYLAGADVPGAWAATRRGRWCWRRRWRGCRPPSSSPIAFRA